MLSSVLVFLFIFKSEICVELIWTTTHMYEAVVQIPLFHKDKHQHHSLGSYPVSCWSARLAFRNQVSICVHVCFCNLCLNSGYPTPVPTLHFEYSAIWLLAIWWGSSPHLLVFRSVLAILGPLFSWNRRNVFSKCFFKELTEFIIRQGS